ncbi:MAG TPA: MFS transporter [Nevskiaceae bacterium]|nr:MFS transporter [Nevskiaceae bacterium]
MTPTEWRAVLGLGLVYALRMAGMFMVLPVLALYAQDLPGGATPQQVGTAIGVYGLANALLQIPLGILSDRIGRKPVIVLGMIVFAIGSLVAGYATSIEMVMLGRLIQGAGAVSSAVAALVADVTREQVRTTAMAIIGAGMGVAFVLALVLGPVFSGFVGVDGIFFLTAGLAVLSLPIVMVGVPTPPPPSAAPSGGFRAAFADPGLLRLDLGIFVLHAMMACLFTAAPLVIVETMELPSPEHWKVYLPVLLLSILPVFPLIRWAETRARGAMVFRAAIAGLAVSMAIAATEHGNVPGLIASLLLYFVAFNYLEGALPSLISRRAPASRKGAALGVYSTAQFLGGFAGAELGGFTREHFGMTAAFAACALLPLVWLLFAQSDDGATVGENGSAVPAGRET